MSLRAPAPLLLLLVGLVAGWKAHAWRTAGDIEGARATAALQTVVIERSQAQASAAVDTTTHHQLDAQQQQTRVITREVIRYAQSPDAGRCPLSARWVQLHDAAATGTPAPAESSGGAVAAGSTPGTDSPGATAPVSDGDALAVIADNYATCQHEITRLQGWQDWYHAVQPIDATEVNHDAQ